MSRIGIRLLAALTADKLCRTDHRMQLPALPASTPVRERERERERWGYKSLARRLYVLATLLYTCIHSAK